MKLFALVITLCCMQLTAATIQIIVTDDAGREQQNVTITLNPDSGTGDDMLASIAAWRNDIETGRVQRFPDTPAGDKAFWKTVVVPSLELKILEFPYQGLSQKETERETANRGVSDEVRGGFK